MLHFNTFMERNIYFQKILRYIKNITTRRILYYREDKISVQIYIFYERKWNLNDSTTILNYDLGISRT